MGTFRTSAVLTVGAVLSIASRARAAPPASTGFQADFGFGLAFPVGTATGAKGDSLARRYAWEIVPINIGLGGKITPSAYVGAYLGLGIGAEGDDTRTTKACASGDDGLFKNDVACTTTTFFLGVKGRYSFLPDRSANPWLSYGVGVEATSFYFTDRLATRNETTTLSGIEYGRLGGGIDFRSGTGGGWGPFFEGSFGTYTHQGTDRNGASTYSGSVPSTTLHGWLMGGIRVVVFP